MLSHGHAAKLAVKQRREQLGSHEEESLVRTPICLYITHSVFVAIFIFESSHLQKL